MTFDRDEQYLHDVLQAGLPTAEADLWPAVAEALPAGQARQRRRTRALRLAICLGAPLLLAAGALLGRAEFTNLREDPHPSFAPENNTGYAIRYDLTAYALPEKLMASLNAHYNGQTDADGLPPMHTSLSGRNLPPASGPGGRGYSTWAELTADTALPLLQSDLLDSGEPLDASFSLWPDISDAPPLPDNWLEMSDEETDAYYDAYYEELYRLAGNWPAGFTVEWEDDAPLYLYPRRMDQLDSGYTVELQAYVLLAAQDRSAGTTRTEHQVYYDKKAGLTWEVEEYTTPAGITALLPLCTSNGKSSPWLNSSAFFEQGGILYRLDVSPCDGFGSTQDGGEAVRAVLKEVLDSFTPPEPAA